MKVISLWEPWASLMAVGAKHNETRSWSTTYLGDLAIAASKRKTRPILQACSDEILIPCFQALREGYELSTPDSSPDYMDANTIGRILCVVRLVQVMPTERFQPQSPEFLFGDYTPGRWAWITNSCRRLREPIPFKGSQGLRDLPADIEEQVRRQL